MVYRSSFSQHNSFHTCPRMWFYNKILKIDIPQDMCYAFAGNVIHKCLELYYNKEITDLEKLKERFNIDWDKKKLPQSKISMKKDEYWLMIINGIDLNKKFTSTELKIFYPDCIGYIDAVNTEEDEISDWKSSTRRKENEEEYKKQLTLYAWLYYRKFNRLPKKCTVYYLKYNGTKGELTVEPTMEDVKNIEIWFNDILKQMEELKETKKLPERCEHCFMFCNYKEICFTNENSLKFIIHRFGNYIRVEGNITPIMNKVIDKKFSYELKDAYYIKKHNPNARTTIKYWHSMKKQLPLGMEKGLIKTLNDYAKFKKMEITIGYKDYRMFDNSVIDMPDKFLNGIVLRDYQKDAVNEFIKNKIAILEIGTGGGKTEVAIECIRRLKHKTLFIVDKIELMRQTKQRIENSLGIEVGQYGSGEKDLKDVTVATIQTLIKTLKPLQKLRQSGLTHKDEGYEEKKNLYNNEYLELVEYLKNIRLSILDECHKTAAISYTTLAKQLIGTEFRLGLCLHKQTNILDNKGHIKNIVTVKIGDKILSFNHKKNIVEEDEVLNVFKREKQEAYKIKIQTNKGLKVIKCSAEHKFFCDGKYVEVTNLKIGNELNLLINAHGKLDNNSKTIKAREKISKKLKGKKHNYSVSSSWKKGHVPWNKEKTKEDYTQIASHRKGLTNEEEYGIEKAKQIKNKNIISHKGQKRSSISIQKQIKTMKERGISAGKKNSGYTTGISYMSNKLKNKINKCQICNILFSSIDVKKGKHIHHKDKNRNNNKEDNLLVVCPKCHMQLHSKLKDRKGNLPEFIRELKLSIKYCEICHKYQNKLKVRFIDKNKKNINRNNLKFLCIKCHQRVYNNTIKLGEKK